MRLSLIVAMSPDHVIGIGNRLPWRLPADLRHFKQTTMGHTLIMGRKTFESIGRPLPGRNTVVVTRSQDFAVEGVAVAGSLDAACRQAEKLEGPQGEAFIAGGGQLYQAAIEHVQRIYLTIVSGEFEGDAFFPALDWDRWEVVSSTDHPSDESNPYPYSFFVLDRRVDANSRETPAST